MLGANSSIIFGLCTIIAGLVTSFLTVRMTRRSARESNKITADNNIISQYRDLLNSNQALLDQVQEERSGKARDIDELRRRIEQNEERQTRRDGIMRRYITELHQHINERKPPPPPAWPEGLD